MKAKFGLKIVFLPMEQSGVKPLLVIHAFAEMTNRPGFSYPDDSQLD
jgi:hypothetical protein